MEGNKEMTDEFTTVLWELQAMHDRKGLDYGTNAEPFANVIAGADFAGIEPWVAALLRASDKMGRLSKAAHGHNLTVETLDDNLVDLAVYAIIALCLHRRTQVDLEPVRNYLHIEQWPEPVSDD